jgi:multidrug efflux pump subunit AcrA (membrane-fusion protein)
MGRPIDIALDDSEPGIDQTAEKLRADVARRRGQRDDNATELLRQLDDEARRKAEEKAARELAERVRLAAEEQARRLAEEQARIAAAEQARREAEEAAQRAAAEQAAREAEEARQRAEDERRRLAAERKARAEPGNAPASKKRNATARRFRNACASAASGSSGCSGRCCWACCCHRCWPSVSSSSTTSKAGVPIRARCQRTVRRSSEGGQREGWRCCPNRNGICMR